MFAVILHMNNCLEERNDCHLPTELMNVQFINAIADTSRENLASLYLPTQISLGENKMINNKQAALILANHPRENYQCRELSTTIHNHLKSGVYLYKRDRLIFYLVFGTAKN
ncbi:hypothetical protein ACJX0J_028016, partial [Zea mays]